jgi:diaminohydroxyphosphoribosylaminopyrimidine deaminase/5-amino-6-(5-phosphoribosylamino)uracil reductase
MIPAFGADERAMRAAIVEARKGVGHTSPNPAVGAVIVRGNRIIARAYHRAAGRPHAEIEAIRALRNPTLAQGATIYVTLEPCSTHGRTPACTDALVEFGFARVVYGATDPNPLHAGRADAILRGAGINVTAGILAEECARLNEAWNHWIVTGLPFVIAKCGMSLDGRIGSPPGRRWITSESARSDAMKLRALTDAVLVGGETVRTDNPRLTVRGIAGARQPWRVVWSRSGDLPPTARLFTDRHRARTLVYTGKPLRVVLRDLGQRDVTSVLIEGGGRVLGEAFDRRLVNKIQFYLAPTILGGLTPAVGGRGVSSNESAVKLDGVEYRRIGGEIRVTGYPSRG